MEPKREERKNQSDDSRRAAECSAACLLFKKALNESLFSFYIEMNDTFTFRLLYFARTKEKYKQSGRNTI